MVSQNPYEATSHVIPQPQPPTTGFVIRFLWACLWRSLLIGIPVMIVVGVVTAMLFVGLGATNAANTAARITTALVSIGLWVPITKSVIGKRLGSHMLIVVPADRDPLV
jgi:hypothetical protein